MTRWVVIFEDKPEMLEIRADKKRRDAHIAYAKAHRELLIGGGLKPDIAADFCGALWIVEANTKTAIEQLIRKDPFYIEAYRSYKIFTWGKILEDEIVTL
ncbi:MAG: YciI family protein [Salaquimonas sp.]